MIRKAALSDIPLIKKLMESVFGPFGRLEEMFTKWITQDQYSVQVAVVDGDIVGVCTWFLKTDNDYTKYKSFGTKAFDFIKDKKSAWVVNLAVAPAFRKNGLGQRLALAHMDWLKNTNCDVVVGSSWVNGTDDNSRHLYLKSGFLKLGESSDFLSDELPKGAVCSVCQTSECRCHSLFFGIEAAQLIDFMEQK